ncbi:MAG TPA: hypothetical protein VHX42_01270 [Candidatus Babeliales bacterium]|jgi:hypothetical protein|nr:hypothetical protein [Candidatus Babeliales bacterium]
MNYFQKLPDKLQGLLCVVAGVVMILYALGLVQKGINFVVIVMAACLMFFGYMKLGIHHKVMRLLHHKR